MCRIFFRKTTFRKVFMERKGLKGLQMIKKYVTYKGSIQAKGADRLSMAAVAVFLVSVSVVVRKEWGSPLFCFVS